MELRIGLWLSTMKLGLENWGPRTHMPNRMVVRRINLLGGYLRRQHDENSEKHREELQIFHLNP